MKTLFEAKRYVLAVLAVLTAVVVFVTGAYAQGKRQIDIEKIKDVDNPNAEFKVDVWVDKEDAAYKAGDEVVFFFKTNKDCRLTLFNVATSGTVQVLFPNEHQKDNLVKAGGTYRIPTEDSKYLFRARGPAGEDVIKAIATLDKVALIDESEMKKAGGGFAEVTGSEKDVAIELRENLKPEKVNPKRWAEAEKVIKISE